MPLIIADDGSCQMGKLAIGLRVNGDCAGSLGGQTLNHVGDKRFAAKISQRFVRSKALRSSTRQNENRYVTCRRHHMIFSKMGRHATP